MPNHSQIWKGEFLNSIVLFFSTAHRASIFNLIPARRPSIPVPGNSLSKISLLGFVFSPIL